MVTVRVMKDCLKEVKSFRTLQITLKGYIATVLFSVQISQGRSPFYVVSVNCLYGDRVRVRVGVRDRVSGRVTDTVRVMVRVRHPDSSALYTSGGQNRIAIRFKSRFEPFCDSI